MRYPWLLYLALLWLLLGCNNGPDTEVTPSPLPTASPAPATVLQATLPPPPPTPTAPAQGEAPPARPTPPFNPFASLSEEQEGCLRAGWGDELFETLTTFQRPPDEGEREVMRRCLPPPPGGPPPREGPPGDATGPYSHQVMLATSTDGLSWEPEEAVLRDHASVPDIVQLADGRVMVYFVDGEVDDTRAIRQGGDGAWEEVEVTIEGRPSEKAWDPTVVRLSDGRVRLFYFAPPPNPGDPSARHIVYSAISEDGVHFTHEPGIRFEHDGLMDPTVVQLPDGRWLMGVMVNRQTLLAISEDGESFTETGTIVEEGGIPDLVLLEDGSLRLYVNGQGGILSLRSTDGGGSWTQEEGVRLRGERGNLAADPGVIQLEPDRWWMVWKRFNPDSPPPPPPPMP